MGDILFLDIEASGLDERAYPIEIGWVTADGGGGDVLIRPAPGWTYWSYKAAWVHGISRDELQRSGVPAADAARRVADAVTGRIVYVDAPEWDRHWLAMLFAEARLSPAYELRDTNALLTRPGLAEARAHADLVAPRTHRALADARHAWTVWRRLQAGMSPSSVPTQQP